MPRITEGIFAGAKGEYGPLIIYNMYGKTYVRTKATRYKDRKSIKQLTQRQRLQVVNNFLRPFKKMLQFTFSGEASGHSPYHAAQSWNMKHGLINGYPDITICKEKALLSKGTLQLPQKVEITPQTNGILLKWDVQNVRGNPDDRLLVIASKENFTRGIYEFTETKRSAGNYHWKCDFCNSPQDEVHVYIAFYNTEENKTSDSLYVSGFA